MTEEKKAFFNIVLPPTSGSPVLGPDAMNLANGKEFNKNLTKEEFNLYLTKNLSGVLQILHACVQQIENLSREVEVLKSSSRKTDK